VRKISQAGVVLTAAALLLTVGVSPAMAAPQDTTTDSTVTGGGLTTIVDGATLTGVLLDGKTTQTATGTSTQWSITDARGTGADWALSVTATAPTSAAGTGVDTVARVLPVGSLTITPGAVGASAGADAVSAISAPELTMDGLAQTLVAATGPQKGTYTLTPSFSLDIPANAYRSNYAAAVDGALNPYTSTLTYTIA